MNDHCWFPPVVAQNYLKDAWNVFDFVTVLGSITDILVTEINVRALSPNNIAVMVMMSWERGRGRGHLYGEHCANKPCSQISKKSHMAEVQSAWWL